VADHTEPRKISSEVTHSPDYRAHGIENAAYWGSPGELYYQPAMDCLCGFSTERCASWEDAGREFDAHLASVLHGARDTKHGTQS